MIVDKLHNYLIYIGLETADCSKRSLRAIPDDLDRDIKVLLFFDNAGAMRHLSTDALRHYAGLQELHLMRDGIESIAASAFRFTRNLQRLDLEGNALTAVPALAFEPLGSLRYLSLSGNPISRITADDFRSLVSLEQLELERCQLEYIDAQVFQPLTQLVQLNLVRNKLQTLDAAAERYLPASLTVLRAHDNPWHCDCHLRWLRLFLARPNVNWKFAGGDSTPQCSLPRIIANISWTHLEPDRFACSSRIEAGKNQTGGTEQRAGTGGNVTFVCHVYGDPRPIIEWRKGSQPVQTTNGKQNAHVLNANATDGRTGEAYIRSMLLLYNAHNENIGEYSCVADNPAGRSEVMFKLIVEARRVDLLPDDVTPAQTKIAGAFGDSAVVSREVLIGVAVGTGTVILLLACVVVFMSRRRCAPGDTQQRRRRKKQRRDDGGNRTAADATSTARRSAGVSGAPHSTLTHNMSGEFSMRTLKNNSGTATTANDRHHGGADSDKEARETLVTSSAEPAPSARVVPPSRPQRVDLRQSDRQNPEETEVLITKDDVVVNSGVTLPSGEAASRPVTLGANGGSPGKSIPPPTTSLRSVQSSPQKPPRFPPPTSPQTSDIQRDSQSAASSTSEATVVVNTRRHTTSEADRSQTLPHRPTRITESFDSDSAVMVGGGVSRTLKPSTSASHTSRERSPCQNPVCLKAHMKGSIVSTTVGSSATLGHPSRRPHAATASAVPASVKQGNGILKGSRSVGHLENDDVDTAVCKHTPPPPSAAANIIGAKPNSSSVTTRAEVTKTLESTSTSNNTHNQQQHQHQRTAELNSTLVGDGIARSSVKAPSVVPLPAAARSSAGVTMLPLETSILPQSSIADAPSSSATTKSQPHYATLRPLRNSSPLHTHSLSAARQSENNVGVAIATNKATTAIVHDTETLPPQQQRDSAKYPRPGERDEFGTAV